MKPPETATQDRVVRVFVSSTFRDMIEDRNELMAQVWPALRKICRGRSVEFVEVDLRWGVTEEQSQRKETLRHCLVEIKRCRPYFIGLLGERYGWTPGPEAYSQALLDEEGWLKNEVAKHSVTELEILHGVLNDPEMAGRAFFYSRDPQYAQTKGGDYQSEDSTRPTRQEMLKQKVKAVCEAKQIPLLENYADPRVLAALVLADLTAAINAEFPSDQVPDIWSREDRDHEAYARSRRTNYYIGRDAYFNRLDALARDGAEGCGLTVLGESGGGKSALLANWVARWRQANPNDFIFQHYIGSSAMSAGHLALMRRLMVSVVRWCGADDPSGIRGLEEEEKKIPAKAEDIVKVFPDYLNRLAFRAKEKGVRAVIVLDAINQLEDRERGRLLAWLPYRLPGELRLIVSTLPGDTFNALQPRNWPALTVEPLAPKERVELIARYLAHFAQGLSDARARKIASVAAASNPLYIKALLDDLRATGDHLLLDKQIDDYLKAADIPALFNKILSRFERDYERDRPGLVREALSLLWAARRGLTEPELLEALKPAGQARLPAALWSPVRCALEDGMVDRDGVLAFTHEHLRTAIEQRYVPDPGTARSLRLRLADNFAGRSVDARQADELPWLLRLAESRDRLRACLLDIDRFLLIRTRDQEELIRYWVWLKEERAMGCPYVESFESWARIERINTVISYAANQLAYFLKHTAFFAEAETLYRRALVINERLDSSHPRVATSLINLAELLRITNRLVEREPLYQQALFIDENWFGSNHPEVASDLNHLSSFFQDTNRSEKAEPLLRRALAIYESNFGLEHPSLTPVLNNLAVLLQNRLQFREAESLILRAFKICESCYGKDHPDIASCLNNLAQLLQDTNRLGEAETSMHRALTIDETSFGADHPTVARDLNNLARLLRVTNRLGEAEPLMRRALAIDETSFGADHPNVASCLNNLAQLLQDTNRLGEAEPLYRRALDIYEKSYGKHDPCVATALNSLAGFLQTTNRLTEAEPLYRRALSILDRGIGENSPCYSTLLSNFAGLLQITNRMADAEVLIRRALAIDERYLGANHPKVSNHLNSLALVLKSLNRLAEAEPLYRRALAILDQGIGGQSPLYSTLLNNLAELLRITNRISEAESLFRCALTIDERYLGSDHPNVALYCHNLALIMEIMNKLTEAEQLRRRALEIQLKFNVTTGYQHPHLNTIVGNYALLLQRMGRNSDQVSEQLNAVAGPFGIQLRRGRTK